MLAAFAAVCLATSASAQQLPDLTFTDLNGARHETHMEWHQGGVLILGFSHDARDAMDHWIAALSLDANDQWLEAPVIGDVSGLIRPMIRSGMRARYDEARRGHVTPVFEGADAVRSIAAPDGDEIVVLVVGPGGDIAAQIRGTATDANVRRAQAALLKIHAPRQ